MAATVSARRIDAAQVWDSARYVDECRFAVEQKREELRQAQETLKRAQRRHEEIRRGR